MLSRVDKLRLWTQLQVSRAVIPVTYYGVIAWMKFIRHYQMPMLAQNRKKFRELVRSGEGPLVICCNHLTAVDSLLIMWALAPGWKCFLRPTLMPWNLPDKANFYGKASVHALCYLGRCLPVMRGGPRQEVRRTLDKVNALLKRGNSILIFPEGGRSRVGRVDTENFSYGVGTILQESPHARVLCVYFRGAEQKDFSNLPKRGDTFYIDLRLVRPSSAHPGLRGARDISTQIIHSLADMEKTYLGAARAARQ